MRANRVRVSAGLLAALLLVSSSLQAQDKPGEPTPEQLQNAKADFARLGANYYRAENAAGKESWHAFAMPEETDDADLKKVPDLPFAFALDFGCTKVTDAGLKELKDLTWLDIASTKVTPAEVKELKGSLPKCEFYLSF